MSFSTIQGTPATVLGTDEVDVLGGVNLSSGFLVYGLDAGDQISLASKSGQALTSFTAYGGDGNDLITLSSPASKSLVQGGNGTDSIAVGPLNIDATVRGGADNDTITATNGGQAAVLQGGKGNDLIRYGGSFTSSSINGGADNDSIFVAGTTSLVSTTINGSDGTDTISDGGNAASFAMDIASLISGGNGNDTISFANINTALIIRGDEDNDAITGGTANDTINGGSGNDVIAGAAGLDRITLGSGSDRVNQNANNISQIATATTFDNDMDGGETATFGNGVDIVTDFDAAIDTVGAAAAGVTAQNLGVAANFDGTALNANQNFALRGNFNQNNNVFTYDVTGADIYFGFCTNASIAAAANQGTRSVILLGGANAGFTTADVVAV